MPQPAPQLRARLLPGLPTHHDDPEEYMMPRRNYRRGVRRRFAGYGPDWITRMYELLALDGRRSQ